MRSLRARRSSERAPERPPPDLAAALAIAARFLASRPRTRQELTRRLVRAGADEAVMDAAMAALTRAGYVDDAAFARYWVEHRDRRAPRGRALLAAELSRLGVAAETSDEAISRGDTPAATDGADGVSSEAARAMAAAERRVRGRRLDATDTAAVRRLLAYLRRRGFADATAIEAVRRLVDGDMAETAADESSASEV